MAKCTWKHCNKEGTHSQKDDNGDDWAVLCDEHNDKLEQALESPDFKLWMRVWVLASGGADVMTKKLFKGA